MSRIIIFGCGGVGIKAMHLLLEQGNEIVCFTDNSSSKWGDYCEGKKIIPPEGILEEEFDYIAIGVFKAVHAIKLQLLNMGISEKSIFVPIEPNRIFPLEANEECLKELEKDEYMSRNTREYLKRNVYIDDKIFLNKLDSLKETLAQNNIPKEKVCIVSGAVLQVLGLRKSKEFDDIDIIMTSDLRKIYGSGLVIVSDTAEMHVQDEYFISDDEIIKKRDYHFACYGLKFIHPQILLKYTKDKNKTEYDLLQNADLWMIDEGQ